MIELSTSKRMKRTILALLLAPLVLPSCETAHNAAVSTFRVIDTPAAYVRRKLEVDQGPQTTTTTTTTETQTYSDTAYPPSQPYPVQPPPPVQTERTVTNQSNPGPSPQPESRPTATPRVVRRENPPHPEPTPRTASSSDLPYGKPVPGKPGYVFSPYDKNGDYVDVTGFSPGQKVKDPYTGKIFLVP